MNTSRFWHAIVMILLLPALFLTGCKPSSYEEAKCAFSVPNGMNIECGYLTVPEDRSRESSRTIRLHVAVVRAENPKPDPIVLLQGGPGANALGFMSNWLYLFKDVRMDRDLIVLDQRGVGYSRPSLNCPEAEEQWFNSWTQNLSMKESDQSYAKALQACHDRLVSEGVNLSAYTSAASAADVEDLREALGYKQWNLYGGSYGTKLALTVMRDYPEGIRSVILDSVYPLQANLYAGPTNSLRSLNLIFERCAANPDCNQAYPDLETTFYDLVDQLDAEPLPLKLYNASNFKFYNGILNGDRLIWTIFQMLYDTGQLSGMPRRIYEIKEGKTDLLATSLQSYIFFDGYWSEGMYYSVQCNEEAPFSSIEATTSASADQPHRVLEATNPSQIYENCAAWVESQPSPSEDEAVTSDIPTLILSGEFDPVTPPAWGQLVAETLSHSQFLEFPGYGHWVFGTGACDGQIVLDFINDPTSTVDTSCINSLDWGFVTE